MNSCLLEQLLTAAWAKAQGSFGPIGSLLCAVRSGFGRVMHFTFAAWKCLLMTRCLFDVNALYRPELTSSSAFTWLETTVRIVSVVVTPEPIACHPCLETTTPRSYHFFTCMCLRLLSACTVRHHRLLQPLRQQLERHPQLQPPEVPPAANGAPTHRHLLRPGQRHGAVLHRGRQQQQRPARVPGGRQHGCAGYIGVDQLRNRAAVIPTAGELLDTMCPAIDYTGMHSALCWELGSNANLPCWHPHA